MKKLLSLFLLVLLAIMPLSAVADTSYPTANVIVDGAEIVFDQSAVIIQNRTLVPLRAIFEALGAFVEWNGEANSVVAKKGNVTITLQIGSNRVYKTTPTMQDYFDIDVPPQLINSRTLVPVRAISEALEAEVSWNGDTKTVTVISKNKNIKDHYLTFNNTYLPDDNTSVILYDIFVAYPQIEGYEKANESIKKMYENKFEEIKTKKAEDAKKDYEGSVSYGWTFIPHDYELLTEVEGIEDGKITLISYETNYTGEVASIKTQTTYVFDLTTGELVK